MDEKKPNPRADGMLIGRKSRSQTLPFLLTFGIFKQNVHNCLVDFGASSNVMPYSVCKKLKAEPRMGKTKIIQLYRSHVKVFRELKDVLIRLSSNSKVHQTIDIIVFDIPETYGVILSKKFVGQIERILFHRLVSSMVTIQRSSKQDQGRSRKLYESHGN